MSHYWDRLGKYEAVQEWQEFLSDVADLFNANVDFSEMFYSLREEGWDFIDFDDLRDAIEEIAYSEAAP